MALLLTLTSGRVYATLPDMTDQEKFKGIVERLKADGWCDDPMYISVMVIINYLDQLQEMKLIESPFSMSPVGKKIVTLVDEFDWKPSDPDVQRFVSEMVEEDHRVPFTFLIKRFRDNKEEFLEEVKKFRESGGE